MFKKDIVILEKVTIWNKYLRRRIKAITVNCLFLPTFGDTYYLWHMFQHIQVSFVVSFFTNLQGDQTSTGQMSRWCNVIAQEESSVLSGMGCGEGEPYLI